LNPSDLSDISERIRHAGKDPQLVACRAELARFAAQEFQSAGEELHVFGHIIGPDGAAGTSPRGHGSDETVGVSVILRIASQLVSASADLFMDGRAYAAAALTRQIVEIEYLAWAFESRDGDAERWLRSTRQERESFFRPVKLREAAKGRFRGVDYSYHCELGGHPVPGGTVLLQDGEAAASQLLLSDVLGHTGRIWDHIVGWARNNDHGGPVLSRNMKMVERFKVWKEQDPLVELPPPPERH